MDDLWRRITLAFLHDPPCKVYDVGRSHEDIAHGFVRNCCADVPLDRESYEKLISGDKPGWAAAAADRIIFPKARLCSEKFSGMIRHPLSGMQLKLDFPSSSMAIELLQNSLGGVNAASWKDFFFMLWRRWREGVMLADSTQQNGPALAMFPADTRLPDHSIWEHMNLTAAFEACRGRENHKITPAFLLFQLGPVQNFIAAARKTNDLWSGSYLLSFMMAQAMKAVCDEIGPSSVIFPNLCGQGVFDLVNKTIFDHITYTGTKNEETLWQHIYGTDGLASDAEKRDEAFERLWSPTLPNRFLALVPADRADELAMIAEQAVKIHWEKICEHCFSRLCKASEDVAQWHERWEKQVGNFWQITYQTMPFFTTADEALKALSDYPEGGMKDTLLRLYRIATEQMPRGDRDERNYADSASTKLSRAEFAWSLNVAEAFRALAARRNTRDFTQFTTDALQEGAPKDALTGKEEVIGSEAIWEKAFLTFFKKNEGPYGAVNIVKRLWSTGRDCYLALLLDESQRDRYLKIRAVQSTEDVAHKNEKMRSYFAILAMDGDGMGKWLNGDNAPQLIDLLEDTPRQYFINNIPDYTLLKRPLSPGYHAQFSEMLTNFTSRIAGKVVTAFDGTLIYAGGDDVLAMVPMDKALSCASALRELFQGRVPQKFQDSWAETGINGFLREVGKHGQGAYLTVPGDRADVSCGIAIGHMHYPLQHLVNEARKAEHRAKEQYERGAVAVSALKRSGEILHWGAKWELGGNMLLNNFSQLLNDEGKVSNRFAYAFAGLCAPYEPKKIAYADEGMREVIITEFDHVCRQQSTRLCPEVKEFQVATHNYFSKEAAIYAHKGCQVFCDNFINLFLLASFISRPGEEEK